MVAPAVTGYLGATAAYNGFIVAVLVIAMAVWEMLTDREFITGWHEHTHLPAH